MTTSTPLSVRLAIKRRRDGSRPVDRRQTVGVPVMVHQHLELELSEPAYDLWIDGRLHGELGIPDDGRYRVEIVGGEVVVSPVPPLAHAGIVGDIRDAFTRAAVNRPGFRWRAFENAAFTLEGVADGYVPDLIVLESDVFDAARIGRATSLTAKQVTLVVEVTSKSNAAEDREPGPRRRRSTKWNGYAREGIPHYLLVDRDPREAKVTLFTEPNRVTGEYASFQTWAFGDALSLPEPFGVSVATTQWHPWTP
jgi:Uma2 family endonuclease